jgi:integrase
MLAAAKPHLYVVLLLCVDAGLRAGEVRGATWRDVDLEAGKLVVRETVVEGLENAPEAFLGLLRGDNTGKMVVRIS